jgi:pullulanase/glycogen debranching enzyme
MPEGHRCNPNNLLLDPYAKAISSESPGVGVSARWGTVLYV